ncbi:MAG: transketolase [Candidatus Taylorbacteria bacterium RIFCSPLOWO2_12_FULL_43_20]|uniref:Transketolase n=1 Tax=Candidatus Taylorbacteria bacterium RIFCSPLOWO2_12_FULL_43_20 TaxID=1802332 RepID=A0A1G2P363_9BACT|nr:MAG: transketolase [Candidatus Taylorbacteria bacterium RIFCSPHIGHO2_01_FULL_43_120]OHA22040.1 MAG: transketolase [Candidatus Taylorbacteria bacterium RIFCSPHIGHO2_02_FULL_43_55]OHA30381.1 MAG: transketolase [Candidatus Taylorbacteria bacterium RIFCSPHIGHO2_12_FULL_42_34]OHA31537.1 MAG: transketolase [Candidatus Taylorbacteria bacterium RIFCSPLOWO2_01_FULL_43_83]OHA39751.1 MAG: transketolase [Candidatus Taylorbacteria bacterium RIFCSPLOWO2_02_FULL_43_22b]OHA42787.1 MAG: transketolase [Candi
MSLTESKIHELEKKANDIRSDVIKMLIEAGSGHTAGPLGMADIFTYLYFFGLNHDPKNPAWEERDRVVLSNGHICPVLYATMAHAGYFPLSELKTLRKFGSHLQGHPHREWLPALETSSGPLGSGLSQAVGMALANRIDKGRTSKIQFYCLTGDGELDEGQNWEAIQLAGKEKIQNLTAIVDRNNIQIDGFTEDIMPLSPLKEKWQAFGWHVQEIDGHSFTDIDDAIGQAQAVFDKSSVIIAYTIPSKGIPDFERKFEWHGKPPTTPAEQKIALNSLRTLGGKIKSEHQ